MSHGSAIPGSGILDRSHVPLLSFSTRFCSSFTWKSSKKTWFHWIESLLVVSELKCLHHLASLQLTLHRGSQLHQFVARQSSPVIVMLLRLCVFTVLLSAIFAYRRSWSPLYTEQRIRLVHSISLNLDSSTKPAQRTSSDPKKDMIRLDKSLPVHIYVDTDVRAFLGMKNSERKARIMLPQEIEEMTRQTLRDYVEKKLPKLSGQPYILRFQVPDQMSITPRQFEGSRAVASTLLFFCVHFYVANSYRCSWVVAYLFTQTIDS